MNQHEQESAVEIERLRYGWPGGPVLLSIDSLTIRRGCTMLIQGPSGSGKTTLLGLITGVLSPIEGRLEVLGQDLTALRPAKKDAFRRDEMGVIFQMFNLLPFLTVTDNILLPLRLSSRRRQKLSHSAMAQEANRLLDALGLPQGIRKRPAHQLSVGQQQRVAAARALIGNPSLVIADEPTSALDEQNQDDFLSLLIEQVRKTQATLIMVSHDSRLTGRFDGVLQL